MQNSSLRNPVLSRQVLAATSARQVPAAISARQVPAAPGARQVPDSSRRSLRSRDVDVPGDVPDEGDAVEPHVPFGMLLFSYTIILFYLRV